MLVRLIYFSLSKIKANQVQEILNSAEQNNEQLNITGLLLFRYKYFFQMLEGSRENINLVYNKLTQDPRHEQVTLLKYSEIDTRIVNNMHMAFLSEDIYNKTAERIFGPYNGLDFSTFSAQTANAFCNVLIYGGNLENR